MLKKFIESAKSLTNTRTLALMGMLLAMHAVLGAFKIPVFSNDNRITLTFAVNAVTGTILGPVPAMLVGGLGDILGYLLNPGGGAYFPGFTISGMLGGLVYGLCLYKRETKRFFWWTMLAVFLITLFVNIILNTFWLSVLYKKAYQIFAASRIIKNFVVYPLHVAVIFILGVFVNKTGIQKKYK
ncbi:MAG: folate family ECF transporter S component [Clostridia bacterium]|nr:folate family ECF transporter S component [Clostridia bacterium]